MVKCTVCRKFLAANIAVKCSICLETFHRACVGLSDSVSIRKEWICPSCKISSLTSSQDRTELHTPVTQKPFSETQHDMSGKDVVPTNIESVVNLDLAKEIRAMREELTALRAEIRECRLDFNSALKSCNEAISCMDSRISALEQERQQNLLNSDAPMLDTIAELKCQLDERDQELMLNDIEISGIPEQKEESVLHIVQVLSSKLGVQIGEQDIVHAERIGSTRRNHVEESSGSSKHANPITARPRNIAVRFTRHSTRFDVLRAARVRRGISSSDLDVIGASQRVYVNERLTSKNKRLFYQVRQAAHQFQWKYVWTRNGKVLARKLDGKPAERIRNDKDITKIFGVTLV